LRGVAVPFLEQRDTSAQGMRSLDIPSQVRRAWVDLEWRADPKPLHNTIETILGEDPNAAPVLVNYWRFLALRERDPAAAQRGLDGMPEAGCYEESIPFPCN